MSRTIGKPPLTPRGFRALSLLGVLLAFGCGSAPRPAPAVLRPRVAPNSRVRVPDYARRLPERSENPQAEIQTLEADLDQDPRTRLRLSELYFQLAQEALERGDEARYTDELARAQTYLLDHIELQPEDAAAQNQLGILAAYRGDFEGSRRSFGIATQLDPVDPIAQLNLAELAVYAGELPEARRRLRLARSRGADEIDAKLVEVLMLWKERDLVSAQDRFERAREISPGRVQGWNGASKIQSFDDLAAHCCRLVFCGPYMEQACGDMNQAVARQKVQEATVLRELQLEIERARRLRQIYERRRDLKIEVDPEEQGAEKPDPAPKP